jgi:RNA polymerase sigma factor (sigma-70 family)
MKEILLVSETVLLERYSKTGDAKAFAELSRRYAGLVYGTCLRVTGNPEDAEDAAQECFLELARNAGTIDTSLPGWLHRVAHRRSANVVRSAVTRRRYEEESVDPGQGSEDLLWSEIRPHVDDAIETLPDEYRSAIVLYYLRQYTQAEVAKELGISQATASRLLDKGVHALRAHLREVGIVAPVAVLALLLAGKTAIAAPSSLTVTLGKMALAGIGSTATRSASKGALSTLSAKLVASAAVVAVAFGVCCLIRAVQTYSPPVSDAPTIQQVVAALKQQESACGGLVELKCKCSQSIGPELDIHYIRTPDTLFVETSQPGSVVTTVFDRNRQEFRQLLAAPSGTNLGSVDTKLQNSSVLHLMPEPTQFYVNGRRLLESIAKGTITGNHKAVDGSTCWGIEVPARRGVASCLAWVDPKIGFCPRVVETHWEDQKRKTAYVTFKNYRKLGKGLWLPMEVQGAGGRQFLTTMENAEVAKTFSKSQLTVTFPSGTQVHDKLHRRLYRVP